MLAIKYNNVLSHKLTSLEVLGTTSCQKQPS